MSFCERFPTEIDQAIIDSILNNDGSTALKDLHALTLTSQAFHHTFNESLYKLDALIFKKEKRTTYWIPSSRRRRPPQADWRNECALDWAVRNAAEGTLLHVLEWTPELLELGHINSAILEGQHAMTELILERAGSRIKSLFERCLFRSRSRPHEPLNLAVELGLNRTVGQLISLYGADYVHDSDWRWDLFREACGCGHLEIVHRLLDDIIEFDDRDYRDFKWVMYTVLFDPLHLDQSPKERRGQRIFTIVDCLLERLSWLAYEKDFLCKVAGQGWEELFDLFLRHGAQIDVSNRAEMQRLLYEAIQGDNPSLVARMLDLGADVGPTCLHTREQKGERFRTAMQVVTAGVTYCGNFIPNLSKCQKPNSVEIARLLVTRGASLSVDQTDAKAASMDRTGSTQTPLGLAIELENYALVEYYLELGAHHLPGELHPLYYSYSAEMAKFLMDYGFDINQPGPDGDLPITRIVKKGWYSQNLVAFYAKHVRNINAVDAKGRTALFSCCSQRSEEFWAEKESILFRIKFLLEQGASLSIHDREGRTALHEAAKYGELETCRLLQGNGMNPNAKDHRGFTPLHEVMDSQSPYSMDHYRELKMVAWLLFQGEADPDIQSDNGTYAMHVPPKLANNPFVINTLVKMYSMHAEQRSGGERLYTHDDALHDICSTSGNAGGFHLRNTDFNGTDATRAFVNRCDRWGKLAFVEMADPNKADTHGVKPLRSAVLHDPVFFEKLLELDDDINAVDESGRTILDILYERLETRPHNIFWRQKRMEQCIKMVEGAGGLRWRDLHRG